MKQLALRSVFIQQRLLEHRCSSLWAVVAVLVEEVASLATQLTRYVPSHHFLGMYSLTEGTVWILQGRTERALFGVGPRVSVLSAVRLCQGIVCVK